MITDKNIDDVKPFDRGRISADHARLRGVCPREFYNHTGPEPGCSEKPLSRGREVDRRGKNYSSDKHSGEISRNFEPFFMRNTA